MSEFRSKSLTVYNEVDLEQLGEEVASKLAWDVRFLSLFWDGGEEEWRSLEGIFLGLVSPLSFFSLMPFDPLILRVPPCD